MASSFQTSIDALIVKHETADAAALAAKDAQITQLMADLAACQAGGGSTGATLTPSGPVRVTANNQIVQNLLITATGTAHGVSVNGFSGVKILGCVIKHEEGCGINASLAPGLIIQGNNIDKSNAPAKGPNLSANSVNIYLYKSDNANVGPLVSTTLTAGTPTTTELAQGNRVSNGSSGIYALECQAPNIQCLEGHNHRGPMPRGQLVQLNKSPNGKIMNFSCVNDPLVANTEDNISIYFSANARVQFGLIDGNNSQTGDGTMVEGTGSTGVIIDSVDCINWGNGAFGAAGGAVVKHTKCRVGKWKLDNGRGPASSNGLMFAALPPCSYSMDATCIYSPDSNPNNIAWDQTQMTAGRPTGPQAFTPRQPLTLPLPV